MFSVQYFNNLVLISAIKLRRISFLNVNKLHDLTKQLLNNACATIMIDLEGVKFIDSRSFLMFMRLNELAKTKNIRLKFLNLDEEVHELFLLVDQDKSLHICSEKEAEELLPVNSF